MIIPNWYIILTYNCRFEVADEQIEGSDAKLRPQRVLHFVYLWLKLLRRGISFSFVSVAPPARYSCISWPSKHRSYLTLVLTCFRLAGLISLVLYLTENQLLSTAMLRRWIYLVWINNLTCRMKEQAVYGHCKVWEGVSCKNNLRFQVVPACEKSEWKTGLEVTTQE